MKAVQYEPCEHRHGCGLVGSHRDSYDTPCPDCAADIESERRALRIIAIVLLVVMVLGFVLRLS